MTSVQKKLAAKILKCGVGRIWIDPSAEKVKQAITKSDIRGFIKDRKIKRLPPKRLAKNQEKSQQRSGSIKGSRGARIEKKKEWFKKVRPQRELLKQLREQKKIDVSNYRIAYMKVKGGNFRSRSHLMTYLKENEIIKEGK